MRGFADLTLCEFAGGLGMFKGFFAAILILMMGQASLVLAADKNIEAEEAVADSEAALADAKEAKRRAEDEKKRRDQAKAQAESTITQAKALEEKSRAEAQFAEKEMNKFRSETDEFERQKKMADEKQNALQKQIQAIAEKMGKTKRRSPFRYRYTEGKSTLQYG